MFASIKKSCTFVLGLSKEVLSPINLLVISFSVINYVVSMSCCRDGHNSFLFCVRPAPECDFFPCLWMPQCDAFGVEPEPAVLGTAVELVAAYGAPES